MQQWSADKSPVFQRALQQQAEYAANNIAERKAKEEQYRLIDSARRAVSKTANLGGMSGAWSCFQVMSARAEFKQNLQTMAGE